jgi:hypothetical protein
MIDVRIPFYIAAAMLFLGATPLPYGYYTLLRLIACGTFSLAAYASFVRSHKVLPWIYAIMAITFNPVLKVHLEKSVWSIIDLGAGIFLLTTIRHLQSKPTIQTAGG